MNKKDLRAQIKQINLPAHTEEANLFLKATLFTPDKVDDCEWLIFCLPGGGNTKQLFELGEADGISYSFADHLTALGHSVIAMDLPGTGENALPSSHPFLKPRQSAIYIGEAFRQFKEQADLTKAKSIACGHSLGGMMSILTQSHLKQHQRAISHKAVLLIGSSAGGLEWGLSDAERPYLNDPDGLDANLENIVMSRYGAEFPFYPSGPRFGSKNFGGETEASNQLLHGVLCTLYAAGGTVSMVRGGFLKDAQELTEPVMMVFAENDLGVPPEEAMKDFKAVASMKLHIMAGASHNCFAFKSLLPMCAQVDAWLKTL